MAVARARPKTISRLSLVNSTSVLVGTFCPPILSIAHLGNRHDVLNVWHGSFRLQVTMRDRGAAFRGHALYVGSAIGREASIADLIQQRSEEHTSELQSHSFISYA